MSSALKIQAFPVFALMGADGLIMASGLRLDQVVTSAHAHA
ncbi:hypothetical protein [Peterkaempfera sp. SMS 1(5)a]